MTSQIVLINQTGIAVASDTMTSYRRSGGHRTYPTANKIFSLGGDHQVVIAHSGSSAIGGLSYELLICEWARQLSNPLPYLRDYPKMFEEWLVGFRKLPIDEATVIYSNLCAAYSEFQRSLPNEIRAKLKSPGTETEVWTQLPKLYRDFADSRFVDPHPYSDLREDKLTKLVKDIEEPTVLEHALQHLGLTHDDDELSEVIDDLPEELNEAIEYFVVQRLRHWMPSRSSGSAAELAFVGFGTEEPVGGLISLHVDGFLQGRLRSRLGHREPAEGDPSEGIITLAQDEAMADFIAGLSADRVRGMAHMAIASLESSAPDLGNDEISAFYEDLENRLKHHLHHEFVQPFRRTLRALSLPSLLQLAESLIRVQALRSATGESEPTVGGKIESLTISRGTGVRWRLRMDDAGNAPLNPVHPLA